ncbi:NADPH-dependent FMN reductase [Alicyclobacillus mengziensis]|uniref:NAD(P)H-dependent oxidoreductase n=1 Tax=Alicyclobacillus mengziensis TaxID=2931921 RepID=A0A9X7Z997_9BACL|nr:NADPH-dependent FMN reductase [Alicyclobacillus mengziensis]QSO49383.1 NAD(P)H-dependent oxidoreductase [Alicyclobacillus mengziensis]
MKLVGLVGSVRKNSYNAMLLGFIGQRYEKDFHLDVTDISSLPYFNQDEENDAPTVVRSFKQTILDADGLVIATPEYNWSIPGILKNALDWLSRGERVAAGKPVLIVGASTGMIGTLRAQVHLRQILSSPGLDCRVLPPGGNEVLVTFAANKFNEGGQLTDEPTVLFLDTVVHKFLDFV